DRAQEVEVVERQQPFGVVDENGVALARAETQKLLKYPPDRGRVSCDLLFGEHLAHLFLAGRIADAGGAAAEQNDRPAASLLQAAQKHDLSEAADVQRRRRHVEADVTGDARGRGFVEAFKIGALMELAARDNVAEEGGVELGGFGVHGEVSWRCIAGRDRLLSRAASGLWGADAQGRAAR